MARYHAFMSGSVGCVIQADTTDGEELVRLALADVHEAFETDPRVEPQESYPWYAAAWRLDPDGVETQVYAAYAPAGTLSLLRGDGTAPGPARYRVEMLFPLYITMDEDTADVIVLLVEAERLVEAAMRRNPAFERFYWLGSNELFRDDDDQTQLFGIEYITDMDKTNALVPWAEHSVRDRARLADAAWEAHRQRLEGQVAAGLAHEFPPPPVPGAVRTVQGTTYTHPSNASEWRSEQDPG